MGGNRNTNRGRLVMTRSIRPSPTLNRLRTFEYACIRSQTLPMTAIEDAFWQACASVPSPLKLRWTAALLNECAAPAIRSPDASARWPSSTWSAVRYLLHLDTLWQQRLADWNWPACQAWLDAQGIPALDPWPLAVLAHHPFTPADAVERFSEFLHHPVTPGPALWAYASWRSVPLRGRRLPPPNAALDINAYRDANWPPAFAHLLAQVAWAVQDEQRDPPHFVHALGTLGEDAPLFSTAEVTDFPARYPYELVACWKKITAAIPEPPAFGPAEQLRFD